MLNPNYTFFSGPITTAATPANALVGDIGIFGVAANGANTLVSINSSTTALSAGTDVTRGYRIGQKLPPTPKSLAAGSWRFSPRLLPFVAVNSEKMDTVLMGGKIKNYEAPTRRTVVIDCENADATAKYTLFKLRLVFKDIRDLSPSVLYQTYYFRAPKGADNAAVAVGLVNAMNAAKDKGILCNVDADIITAGTINLVGDDVLYNINQRYEWTMVNFDASLAMTIEEGSMVSNQEELSGGRVHTLTETNPSVNLNYGSGDGRIVCDEEKRAQARMGITNWTHFPVVMPQMFADPSLTYVKASADFSRSYRAADDTMDVQTNEQLVLYFTKNATAATAANQLANIQWLFGA